MKCIKTLLKRPVCSFQQIKYAKIKHYIYIIIYYNNINSNK